MRAAVVALALLTLTACGGPERPFELGLKEVPSDLLLGRQTKPPAPLPAQIPPQTFFADVSAGPLPTASTLPPPIPDPPPPPAPCPAADPRAPARIPAAIDITRPPVEAAYTYNTTGVVTGPNPRTIGPVTIHEVANVLPGAVGEFYFDVRVVDGERTTTTTYHIVPRSSAVVPPGLYISRVDSGGIVPPFEPVPELLLLPFPALPGTTFTAAGSDGVTTVTYDGVVTGTARVDACGTNVDGIEVTINNGRATTGREQEDRFLAEQFRAAYVIATQYGGISLSDFVSATLLNTPASRELRSVISQEPKS